MITAAAMAMTAVLAFFVTACRVVKLRRLLGWGMMLDVSFSLIIFGAFAGTLTGLLIATFAGLFMALTISILRAFGGYEKAYFIRRPRSLRYRIYWLYFAPAWRIRAGTWLERTMRPFERITQNETDNT